VSETLDVLLWCAALATWLMMFFAIVRESLKKLVLFIRGRTSRLRQAPPNRHQGADR